MVTLLKFLQIGDIFFYLVYIIQSQKTDTKPVKKYLSSKASEETSKSEDAVKVKIDQEADNDCAINALKEAFAAVGYSPGPEGPSSFAEVGNPVMALVS